ncbi:MAG: VWA domain-containing protein [Candidatus Marinimicrobia bacterium]|nr:VWA domain-containing protein [Candidatus Neomarinimicrobiota bacterium]
MAVALVAFWFMRGRREREQNEWGTQKVRARLFARINQIGTKWRHILHWVGIVMLILASTGPQIGTQLREVKREGVDVLVALDISNSMLARDVRPNRLDRAKFEVRQFFSRLRGDRVGMIVFAGTSHLYLPFTGDYDAARLFLDAVETSMIEIQGTALADAINLATESFPDDDPKFRTIILLTDGEDHEGDISTAVQKAKSEGIIIHVAGVGSQDHVPIPVVNSKGMVTDYMKSPSGDLITTGLNDEILRTIAIDTDGQYIRMDDGSVGIALITDTIAGMEKKTLQTHEYAGFEDRYQYFAAIALILFLIEPLISTRKREERKWRGRYV